jgi:hypothetical protein
MYHKVGSEDFILLMSFPAVVLALCLLCTIFCIWQEGVLELRQMAHH